MTNPLKSILITDWSPRHLAGHDLDGGAVVSYNLDTTLVGTEGLGNDQARWSVGDIATLRIDPESQLAQLRIVTAKNSILRAREFQIFDIAHTVDERSRGANDEHGRHIFLKAAAKDGAVYVLPMLGYTAWTAAWDFSNLEQRLRKFQCRSLEKDCASAQISYDVAVQKTRPSDGQLAQLINQYNEIFYPDCKNGTPLDRATSFTTTIFTLRQSGTSPCAHMFVAAFIKKTNMLPEHGTAELPCIKRGTAFSPPYFKIGDEKVFIRTNQVAG